MPAAHTAGGAFLPLIWILDRSHTAATTAPQE